MKTITKTTRVDFSHNKRDVRALELAACSLTTKAIARQTGLTPGQVAYRLHKGGGAVDRREIREGRGAFAEILLHAARTRIESEVERQLRRRGLWELNGRKR